MDSNIWVLAFSFLLVVSDLLYRQIIRSIEKKPLGSQSLYDVLLVDHFWVMRLSGKVYSLTAILSRLISYEILLSHTVYTQCLCSVYDFAFASACFSTGKLILFFVIVARLPALYFLADCGSSVAAICIQYSNLVSSIIRLRWFVVGN